MLSIGVLMARGLHKKNVRPKAHSVRSAPPPQPAAAATATGDVDDEDNDEDDDDDDLFENVSPAVRGGKKRNASEATPRNALAVGSTWDDEDDVLAHDRVRTAFVRTTNKKHHASLGTTFLTAVSALTANKLAQRKGQLQINCYYHGKRARKNCCCDFGISVYAKRGSATVTRLGLEHSSECEVFSKGGRRHGAKTSFLGLDTTASWASGLHTFGTSGLQSGLGRTLQHGVMKHDGVRLTKETANRIIRDMRDVTIPKFLEGMARLAPFLLACREIDPVGVYLVGTEHGTYALDGVDVGTMREFKWLICIPSYAKRFWQGSDSRVMSIDMAHRGVSVLALFRGGAVDR